MVSKLGNTSGTQYLCDGSTSTGKQAIFIDAGDLYFRTNFATAMVQTADTNHNIYTALYDTSNSKFWINQTQIGTTFNVSVGPQEGVVLGARYNNASSFLLNWIDFLERKR